MKKSREKILVSAYDVYAKYATRTSDTKQIIMIYRLLLRQKIHEYCILERRQHWRSMRPRRIGEGAS